MRILVGARDRVLLRAQLGVPTHVAVAVGIPQPVGHHSVHHLGVAHARAEARLGHDVRYVGHRLEAAGNDHVRQAQLDLLRSEHDGLHAAAAHLVDGRALGGVGQPRLTRRLAGWRLSDARG